MEDYKITRKAILTNNTVQGYDRILYIQKKTIDHRNADDLEEFEKTINYYIIIDFIIEGIKDRLSLSFPNPIDMEITFKQIKELMT